MQDHSDWATTINCSSSARYPNDNHSFEKLNGPKHPFDHEINCRKNAKLFNLTTAKHIEILKSSLLNTTKLVSRAEAAKMQRQFICTYLHALQRFIWMGPVMRMVNASFAWFVPKIILLKLYFRH